jgi:hypothetical protein
MSIKITYKGDGNINFPVGSGGINIIPDSVAQSPQNQNLIYLFDPVYYNGYTTGGTLYNSHLNKIFQRYPSIIPASINVNSRGHIFNKPNDPNNLIRKANFNNFFFSYDKYANNSDVFIGRKMQMSQRNGVVERRLALLQLDDPYKATTFNILRENTSKTFSCFIKLKGPVKHKSSNSLKVIREKKGIFLNTKEFNIGYRSPHYTRTGNINGYKFQFEPFSFVFGMIDQGRHHTFMTDFKYKFNETYHLTITTECGPKSLSPAYLGTLKVKVYINGEQQTCAYLPFNPLIGGNGLGALNTSRTQSKKEKRLKSPIQPNFYKFDGTIYSPIANEFNLNARLEGPNMGRGSYILVGRSNFPSGRNRFYGDRSNLGQRCAKMVKRFLNNIDIGVIQIYNTALSQIDIKKIYDTFGKRYQ